MYQNENNTGKPTGAFLEEKKNQPTFNSIKRRDRLFILHVCTHIDLYMYL